MDLTKDQIDQIVELEFRRLERDYQRTIAADHQEFAKIEGTPNLDALIRESMTSKSMLTPMMPDHEARKTDDRHAEEYEKSWETEESDDGENEAAEGFQELKDEAVINQAGNDCHFADQEDDAKIIDRREEIGDEAHKKSIKPAIFEEVRFQERKSTKVDYGKVREAMAGINFQTPEWAKE